MSASPLNSGHAEHRHECLLGANSRHQLSPVQRGRYSLDHIGVSQNLLCFSYLISQVALWLTILAWRPPTVS